MRTLTRCGILVLVATAVFLAPVQSLALESQSLRLDLGLGSVYDDNILQYSDYQLRDFASGAHPLRYSIESTDDAIFKPSAALIWQLNRDRARSHTLRMRAEGNFHARNSTADFRTWSASWTEAFRRGQRLNLGYYKLHGYYLRQLRDEDFPAQLGDYRYRRAAFDLQIGSVSWRRWFGRRLHGGLGYQYEDRRYVTEFKERDSGTHMGALNVGWGKPAGIDIIQASLAYRTSDARATDGDETPGGGDDDVSYHGIVVGAEGRMEFSRRGSWRFGADFDYKLQTRSYDSSLRSDLYHFGRNDVLNAATAGLRLGYRPHWSARAYLGIEHNRAHLGTSAPPSSDSGTYQVMQAGLAIGWTGQLWHQAASREDED